MRLSTAAIREFKEIYEMEFGERLSDVQAEQAGLRLLRLCRILAQPPESEGSHSQSSVSPGGTPNDGKVR